MHSARVQQRRQPQRGERPGAGGRSQLGGHAQSRDAAGRGGWRARPRCAIPPPRPRPPPADNTHMCVTAESGEAEGSRRRARAPAPPPSRAPPCPRRPAERTMPAKRSPAPPSPKYQYELCPCPHLREGAALQRSSQPATRRETLGCHARSGALQQLQLCDYGGRAADTARLRRRWVDEGEDGTGLAVGSKHTRATVQ